MKSHVLQMPVFKIDDEHGSWNASVTGYSEVADKRISSEDKDITDCRQVGDQEGPMSHSNGCKRGLEPPTDKDELWSGPEFERLIIVDSFTDGGETESGDSVSLSTPVLQMFESDSRMHFYTDKSVEECELPEVTVCYKESNYNVIKDICVDEGLPTQDKTLIETDKDDHTGFLVSRPLGEDERSGVTKECHDVEPSRDGFEASILKDKAKSVCSERGTKEVDTATFSLGGSKSSLEDDFVEDAIKVHGPGNLTQMGETICCTTERTEVDVSENESASSSIHRTQELILQDSRLDTSSIEIEAPKQLDEVPSVETIFEGLAVAFTTEDSKKNAPSSSLQYNSKVEDGTITFAFNSSKPALDSPKDGSTENSHEEESFKSEDLPNTKNGNLDNLPSTLPQRASIAEQNGDNEPGAQSEGAVDHSGHVHHGGGESSFSSSGPVSGLITYSGPIAYSGSISLRSDSSTTSTRSFAFPVLQSEWNSSPVRMAKAERRKFRKHRGWRQGLCCCRF